MVFDALYKSPKETIHLNNDISNIIDRLYQKETKETVWSLATKGVSAVLFIPLNIFLGRFLGVSEYGTWSFLLSSLMIVFTLSYLGINNATRVFAARITGTEKVRNFMSQSLLLRLGVTILFSILFWLLSSPLSLVLGRPELMVYFQAATPLVFFAGMLEYFKQLFTGLYRLKYHFYINLVEFSLKLILVFWLLQITSSIFNALNAFNISLAAASILGFVFFYGYYRTSPEGSKEKTNLLELLRYSIPLFVISLGFLALTEIDTIMLGILSSDEQVGLFSAGKQLANKLPQISLALSMGTMPGFAKLNSENRINFKHKFKRYVQINALIFIPLGIALIIAAPLLLTTLYGQEFENGVLPFQILVFWVVMMSFNMFYNALLDYQGLAVRRAYHFSFTLIATVLLNLYLIPRMGAVGAAISTTVSYMPFLVLNIISSTRLFK